MKRPGLLRRIIPPISVMGGPATDLAAPVAAQYEALPYPRVPLAALPAAAAPALRYPREHDQDLRILVAGSGTFEAILVARIHPRARIVAVDLSRAALKVLRGRALLAGIGARLGYVQADLHRDLAPELGRFDYIVCTGVVHHSPDPGRLLASLGALLNPAGVLRLMTYAARSRVWVYELRRFFEEQGIVKAPGLGRRCRKAVSALPPDHPLRSTFENYADARSLAGLVDGFFHACDQPIPLRTLRRLCAQAGLGLQGFAHARHSQPDGFEDAWRKSGARGELLGAWRSLGAWEQIALLDDLCELAVNPIFWLSRGTEPEPAAPERGPVFGPGPDDRERRPVPWPESVPERVRAEMLGGLAGFTRALDLRPADLAALERVLEPRVNRRGRELPWLSTGDLIRALRVSGLSHEDVLAWSSLYMGQKGGGGVTSHSTNSTTSRGGRL